jgi:hypothetical protein
MKVSSFFVQKLHFYKPASYLQLCHAYQKKRSGHINIKRKVDLPIQTFCPRFGPNKEALVFDNDGVAGHLVQVDIFVKNLESNVENILKVLCLKRKILLTRFKWFF